MLAYALPTTLAIFLQLHVSTFGVRSAAAPTLLATCTAIIFVLSFIRIFCIIRDVSSAKFERVVYIEWYGTLWEDLKLESFAKHYYWLLSMRSILLAYLCVFFSLYPFVQLTVLVLFQGFIISLFLNGRKLREVFESRSLTIVTLTEELLLLTTKATILTFMISGYFVDGDDWFLAFGWLIILPGILTQISQSLYLVGVKIKDRKKIVKKIKSIVDRICRKRLSCISFGGYNRSYQ